MFAQFNAPIAVILDNDNSGDKLKSNQNLATCFGLEAKTFLHNESVYQKIASANDPKSNLYVLNQDFETAIKNDLKDNALYETLENEARNIIKPIGSQNKGQMARYIARQLKARRSDYTPSFIKDLAQEIRSRLSIEQKTEQKNVEPLHNFELEEIPF